MENHTVFRNGGENPDDAARVVVVGTTDRSRRWPHKRPGWRALSASALIVAAIAALAGLARNPPPPIDKQRTDAVRTVEELIDALNAGDFDRYRAIITDSLLGRSGRQVGVCDSAACAATEQTPDVAVIEAARGQMAFWYTVGSRWSLEDCDSGPSTAGGVWVTCEATFDSPIHRLAGENVDTNPTLWFRFEERGQMVLAGPILDRYSPPIDRLLDHYPPVQHGDGAELGPCGLLPWATRLDARCAKWLVDEITAL